MKNSHVAKIVGTGTLVVGLCITLGSVVQANTNSSTTSATVGAGFGDGGKVTIRAIGATDTLQEALNQLVADGTITQDTAKAVLAYVQNHITITIPGSGPDKKGPVTIGVQGSDTAGGTITYSDDGQNTVKMRIDPLGDLVKKGTITDAQAQAIKNAEVTIISQQLEQEWQTILNPLVKNGTISQEQESKILSFVKTNNSNKSELKTDAALGPKQSLSDGPRIISPFQALIDQMVSQGIINQQQANAIEKALPQPVTSKGEASLGVGTRTASLTIGGPGGSLTIDLVADAAKALNLSTSTLQSDLAKGISLATVAAQNGSSVSALEAAIVKEATTEIQNAEADGTLTATQASNLEANLNRIVDQFVTSTPGTPPGQVTVSVGSGSH